MRSPRRPVAQSDGSRRRATGAGGLRYALTTTTLHGRIRRAGHRYGTSGTCPQVCSGIKRV
ncbi:hypothetical protein BC628DRAFT_33158 [Trametes gibbosa]|nr:hypothetical protein BC628DRAFT_33158 [Trametes gibbosa]